MSFHSQSFAQRFASLGDEAEAVYEAVLPLGNSEEFGWRRPKVTMKNMTNKIKNKPDFYAGAGFLVEVMGCGNDLTLKLKTNKWDALKEWNADQPLCLFVWNTKLKEWLLLDWPALKAVVRIALLSGDVRQFHDGPRYYPLPWNTLQGYAVNRGNYEPKE